MKILFLPKIAVNNSFITAIESLTNALNKTTPFTYGYFMFKLSYFDK